MAQIECEVAAQKRTELEEKSGNAPRKLDSRSEASDLSASGCVSEFAKYNEKSSSRTAGASSSDSHLTKPSAVDAGAESRESPRNVFVRTLPGITSF